MAGRWSKLQSVGRSVLDRLFSPKAAGTCRVVPVANPTQQFDNPLKGSIRNYGRPGTSRTSGLYFTASGRCERINLNNSGYMTLAQAFKNQQTRYFSNSGSNIYCFSKLSVDIFSQIAAVAFQKAIKENKFFCFNAKNIILKQEGRGITVFVPESDIASNKKKTIYTDRVVGPLATLMYSLHNEKTKAQKNQYQNKEILDLLDMSQNGSSWWSTLDNILDHAAFWPVEKKFAAIVSSTMRVGTGKSNLKHGIPGTKVRTRKFKQQDFMKALDNFYQKVYTVNLIDGEYKVSCSIDTSRNWENEFTRAFHSHYPFGSSNDPVPVRILKFSGHIIVHFPDENFDAYADLLTRQTVAVATIELDRKFSLSLAIYHAFRALSWSKLSDVLDVPF